MRRAVSVPLILVGLLAAGCSASSSSPSGSAAATSAPAASAASTSSAASASAASGSSAAASSAPSASAVAQQLTGTQLKSTLAPATWFPKGFTADAGGAQDSGDSGTPDKPEAFGKLPCSRLNGTAWVALSGIASTAFAQDDYVNPAGGQYIQEVDGYSDGAAAEQVIANLAATAKRCPTFRDDQTGATVKVSAGKGPTLGDASLEIRLRGSNWAGDMTLQAVRVGSDVVTVAYSAGTGTSEAQATKLTTYVVGGLKKTLAAG